MRFLIFVFFVFIYNAHAQNYGEVEYVYVNKIINYKSTEVLNYTPTHAHSITLKSDELTKEIRTIDEDGTIQIKLPDSDIRPELYIDRQQNTLFDIKHAFREIYVLEETIPKIAWKIEQEFKDLNTLKCQKATGFFRGRTYIAWFAKDIPVPYGPWKLQGLPGLILEVKDTKNLILFKVSRFTPKNIGQEIKVPNGTKKMSLKEFLTIEAPKKEEEIFAYVASLNTDRDTKIISSTSIKPVGLELIFEWEDDYPKSN